MSEPNQEPTMEEILASIRRIISEDDAPPEASEPEDAPEVTAAPEAPEPAAPSPVVLEEPPAAVEEDDEVLELTDRVEDAPEPAESHGDIDVYAAPEPNLPPMPTIPPPRPAARAYDADEPLVGRLAEQSAASAFGQLAQSITMPRDGRTLEDVVRELLHPLLKAWLDEHLPRIVQAKVEAEVERIARGGGR